MNDYGEQKFKEDIIDPIFKITDALKSSHDFVRIIHLLIDKYKQEYNPDILSTEMQDSVRHFLFVSSQTEMEAEEKYLRIENLKLAVLYEMGKSAFHQ